MRYPIWRFFNVLIFCACSFTCYSQTTPPLTLQNAVEMARSNSLRYKIAVNSNMSSYWNYEAYHASLLPKVSVGGSLPEYYQTINKLILPDGKSDFVSQNVAYSVLNLNIAQNVPFTGGNVTVTSELQRIDNFGATSNSVYSSVPLRLNYHQNNIFFNQYKWQQKIEPLRLKEAARAFVEEMEEISIETAEKYFALLLVNTRMKLDEQNVRNIDTLLKITQARFDIGTAQLNDLLQVKVSLMNARKNSNATALTFQDREQELIRFLALAKDAHPQTLIPDSLHFFTVDPAEALRLARENRKYIVEHQRKRIEAESSVKRIKAETGPSVSVNVNLGLTQTGQNIPLAYNNLLRNQSLAIGFIIPLIDWGANRASIKKAEADLSLQAYSIEQELLLIEQEILYHVTRWRQQQEQMEFARQSMQLSQQRYQIAKEKYTVGSLSFTDFNTAQMEKDAGIIDYIQNVYDYWSLYFLLRRLTLYDFEHQKNIAVTVRQAG